MDYTVPGVLDRALTMVPSILSEVCTELDLRDDECKPWLGQNFPPGIVLMNLDNNWW